MKNRGAPILISVSVPISTDISISVILVRILVKIYVWPTNIIWYQYKYQQCRHISESFVDQYNCSECRKNMLKQQLGLFYIVDNVNLTCIVTEYLKLE